MRRAQIGKRIAASLLTAALMAGMLIGCGTTGGTGTVDTESGGGSSTGTGDGVAQEDEQGIAMGRYVEKQVPLGDNALTDWNSRVFKMDDGSLLLADNSGFILRSTDNAASWVRDDPAWLKKMKDENKYIRSMAIGPDQTAAVLWTEPEEGSEGGDGVQLKMEMQVTIVKPDNTEIPVDLKLSPEDVSADAVYITDSGRVLVVTYGSTLYEAKEDGSCEPFLTLGEGRPDLLRFHGNLMLMDGWGYDVPLLYDMEEKEYIEDEVLSDFVKENFADRSWVCGRSYDLFLVSGGDDVIYVAGRSGVYRHVLGGSAMEQIIDGSLNLLGNPAYSIMDLFVLDDNEFLALFTPGKALHFVYDPNVPARPNEKLKVWSLEEKSTIQQAISLYQTNNPAVYVEYEVGMVPGQVMTREDVIKNLNTSIMAGKGPDVLIMDDMPLDSYIEKGILIDISPVLADMTGDAAVFPNLVEACTKDGQVYTVPCEIQLPYILGKGDDINKMTDLSGIADAMEGMRANGSKLAPMQLPSGKCMMRIFAAASAPVWKAEDGTLNSEAIQEFLIQTKRMYDAEMDGVSEEALQQWEGTKSMYQEYYSKDGGSLEDCNAIRMNNQGIFYVGGTRQFTAGTLQNIDAYICHTSIAVEEGFEGCTTIPMKGQSENVFWARTLLGINAKSEHIDLAQEFLKAALDGEVQINVTDGIPVNKKAILDNYANRRRLYKDNDYVSGSFWIETDDGDEIEGVIRIPEEDKMNELIKWIESVDTVYLEDAIFEDVVYEEGAAYIEGEKSLTDAMDSIERRLGIYLAE